MYNRRVVKYHDSEFVPQKQTRFSAVGRADNKERRIEQNFVEGL